jgi:hypothetical protein
VSPYEQAAKAFEAKPHPRTFTDDIESHLMSEAGYVFSTPDFFIMGRAVVRGAPVDAIVDPEVIFPAHLCDCWHVYLAAGNLAKAWDILPWRLPYLSFERGNELRVYPIETVRRLTCL